MNVMDLGKDGKDFLRRHGYKTEDVGNNDLVILYTTGVADAAGRVGDAAGVEVDARHVRLSPTLRQGGVGDGLAVANADAILRIWRSAWAWMPVDRAKGVFRLAWVAAGVVLYALLAGAAWLVLAA
jgi:hypothetical protein